MEKSFLIFALSLEKRDILSRVSECDVLFVVFFLSGVCGRRMDGWMVVVGLIEDGPQEPFIVMKWGRGGGGTSGAWAESLFRGL